MAPHPALHAPIAIGDITGGEENAPIGLHSACSALTSTRPPPRAPPRDSNVAEPPAWQQALDSFTYVRRSLNRTLVDDEAVMLPELLERRAPRGILSCRMLVERLRQCHGEQDNLFQHRKRQALLVAANAEPSVEAGASGAAGALGAAGASGAAELCKRDAEHSGEARTSTAEPAAEPAPEDGAAVTKLGCSKCRWRPGGCGRCRAPGFAPGANEGRASGIPQPGSEAALAVVGNAHDEGGVRARVVVSDATPICATLREAGLPGGLGLLTLDPIEAGTPVIEYVGEVLTRAQAELRESAYARQGHRHSYPLFTERFVIDATLYGNAARFMNGSCDPNLRPTRLPHPNMPRVLFRATRPIAVGEELTWTYGAARYERDIQRRGGASHKCFCGAARCRGVLA